ncbi:MULTISPECIES: phosphate ABC transporter substrate-binding protein PstS [Kribbella]|uniref:Phosphate-binding protein n=1 Tax=Kribbella pratensis TaxID=2512112 RepID=A0ABY2FGZ6_9ACTN|nr:MULTISPECIES: phosphate ABC transporter substrate-binding protein PstS [Kribbella]TDW90651.1 phosphate ABC transporter substrate-binding protein (PhoT family) [Kribbella pratensis]TDW98383.1 phosphate ABC transporter substrate-binding protein (PhoT family) [Kribbella sp. VKM Ac-2566]
MSVNRLFRVGSVAVASLGVLALSACGSDPEPAGSSSPDSSTSSAGAECPKGTLNAEGSSAQKNAIEEVISKYNEKCADVTVNYNPTGSGAGIKQFNAGQVDFAGSDSALKPAEMTAATKRCAGNAAVDLPMVIGPVAIAYNVDGVTKLVLDGPTAAKIFQGTIKTWNDPAIAKLNAGVTLPSAPISVFFRSDESGTTENFTKYLKAAGGGAWTGEPAKKWTGTGAGKEKSAGVAEGVKSSKNSITYVEWSYAVDNKLGVAQIETGSGTPVELSADSAGKALAAAKPAGTGSDLALKLDYATKAPGAYPIILVTYEIACTKGLPAEKTALVKSFLSYFVSKDGQASLTDLNYAPLPAEIQTKVEAAIQAIS